MVEINWQAIFGGLLIASGAGWGGWQLWRSKSAKQASSLATEAEFQVVSNTLREAYAAAIAENRKLHSELAAIRKVVGDPLPEDDSKPAARGKK